MENKAYILYKHTTPCGKVYIGITCQTPNKRWRNGQGYVKNKHFYRAIKKYTWDNIIHEIIKENLPLEEAKLEEKKLIQEYKSNNPVFGYNKTRGGDTRCSPSKETREKIRKANKGKIVSEETKKKISNWKKTHPTPSRTKEWNKNISLSLIGNQRALGHHNSKNQILQETLDGKVVKVFYNSVNAGNEVGCDGGAIRKAAKENAYSKNLSETKYGGIYFGYRWFLLDNEGNKIESSHEALKINKRNRKVSQYTLDWQYVTSFETIKQASIAIGCQAEGIRLACKYNENPQNEIKYKGKYAGYYWKYAD